MKQLSLIALFCLMLIVLATPLTSAPVTAKFNEGDAGGPVLSSVSYAGKKIEVDW